MNYCICGRPSENYETGLCATCSFNFRKQQRISERRDNTKRKAIKRISESQKERLMKYYARVKEWIKDKQCAICGNKATDCHHKQGRRGTLLLDETKWLPVCRKCHQCITQDSRWAIENGYSELRSK